jgi:tetratricopeptide (TPR) repeat protein
VLSLNPDDTHALLQRAIAEFYLEDYQAAITDLTSGLKIQSSNSTLRYWRGFIHYYIGDYGETISDLSESIREYPSESYLRRGLIYYGFRQYHLARSDFISAVQHNPKNTLAYYWRAETECKLGNMDASTTALQIAIKLDVDDFYGFSSGLQRCNRFALSYQRVQRKQTWATPEAPDD